MTYAKKVFILALLCVFTTIIIGCDKLPTEIEIENENIISKDNSNNEQVLQDEIERGENTDENKNTDNIKKEYRIDYENLPDKLTLIAIKDTKVLELWVEDENEIYFVKDYPILGASGVLGQKRIQGDHQVPEGIYEIEYLNPNSKYHLSMKINYPNEFDKKNAKVEGRNNLGGNIFIHGKVFSLGCIAIGDTAIEELYKLVLEIRKENIKVVIAPYDFRIKTSSEEISETWIKDLYINISQEMEQYSKSD